MKKQRKTLEAIYRTPTLSNILWKDIESLLISLGSEISEGSGSRIQIKLNGERAVFHRPHQSPTTDKGAVTSMKKFLKNAGVNP